MAEVAAEKPQIELKDMAKMPMTKVIVHAPSGVHTGSTEKCWAKVNEYIQLIPYEIETDVPEDMVTMLENAWVNVERVAAQPKATQTATMKPHVEEARHVEEHKADAGKKN